MDKALVSIIVPIYNTAEYVEECIQSILSQSYQPIELILVNDGSTDGSGEICKKYEQLPNVHYIEKENAGVVAARKRGVEEATGEWMMFVDADDCLLKDGVSELLSISEGVDIVVGCHAGCTQLINALDEYDREEYLFMLSSSRFPMSPWAKFFRTQLFRECQQAFAHNYPIWEDFFMNLELAKTNNKKVAVCRKPVYSYRVRMGSALSRHPLDLDAYDDFCHIADTIVADGLPEDRKKRAMTELRIRSYQLYLMKNDYQGNKRHPFVQETIRLMNEVGDHRFMDQLILSVSNKSVLWCCLFLNKLIRRMENPSIIVRDFKRLHS